MNSLSDVTAMVDRNCSDLNVFFQGRPAQSATDAAAPDPTVVREIPRLQELVRTRILNSNLDVSRLPLDFNRQLLENVKNLTDWLRARNLCCDEAVSQNSTQLASLIKQRPITDSTESDRVILKHVFNHILTTTATGEELDDLMDWKRSCRSLIKESPHILSELAQIVFYYASRVIDSPYFKIVGGAASLYVTWTLSRKVTAVVSAFTFSNGGPLATKYLPASLVDKALFVLNNRLKIYLSCVAANIIAKIFSPTLSRWVFKPLELAVDYTIVLDGTLLGKTLEISLDAAIFFMRKSVVLSAEIDRLNDAWIDLRIEKEAYEAREEWIRQVLQDRNNARTQVEADYATLT